MLCKEQVIFYGAGPYPSQHWKRFQNEGYLPLCVCDRDETKQHRPFGSYSEIMVLPLVKAREQYPDKRIYVTVSHTALGTVLHYLTAECGIAKDQIAH